MIKLNEMPRINDITIVISGMVTLEGYSWRNFDASSLRVTYTREMGSYPIQEGIRLAGLGTKALRKGKRR